MPALKALDKFKKNNPNKIQEFIEFIKTNNLNDLPDEQQLYHFKANLTKRPQCQGKHCVNTLSPKFPRFISLKQGYKEYCPKCSHSAPEVNIKREKTVLEKYGKRNIAQTEIAQENTKKTFNKKYKGGHPMTDEKIKEKVKQTTFDKHGYYSPFAKGEKRDEIRNKIKEKHNGEDIPMRIPELRKKIEKTNLEKYNKTYFLATETNRKLLKDKTIQQKAKDSRQKTLSNLYNDPNATSSPFSIEEIRNKSNETLKERYGKNITHNSQIPGVNEKISQSHLKLRREIGDMIDMKRELTNLERYGVKYFSQVNVEQKINKWIERYGVDNPFKSDEVKAIIKEKLPETLKKKKLKVDSRTPEEKQKILEKIQNTLLEKYSVICSLQLKRPSKESKNEKFLKTLFNANAIKIEGYWFDIFIEDKNIVIEYDGEYWHPLIIKNLNLQQINGVFYDTIKDEVMKNHPEYKFYRIRENVIEKARKNNITIDLAFIINNSYTRNINYDSINPLEIVSTEILEKYLETHTKKKLLYNLESLVRLYDTFFNIQIENLEDFIIKNYNIKF